MIKWNSFKASVQGASHIRKGLPNQDSCKSATLQEGKVAYGVIADGHGSSRHCRSDRGSRFAVDAFEEICELALKSGEFREAIQEKRASSYLDKVIDMTVDSWVRCVTADFLAEPFSESEIASMSKSKRSIEPGTITETSTAADLIAYGSTLGFCICVETTLLFGILGDGDILLATQGPAEDVDIKSIFPCMDVLKGSNETSSLCLRDCKMRFRKTKVEMELSTKGLVLLSTDGYSNSFSDDESFFKVARDIYTKISGSMGLSDLAESLPGWLSETSETGSGDDISVVALCRGY